jgi:hypothetical protein
MANKTIEEKIAEDAKSNPLTAVMGQLLVDEPERRLFHTDMATLTALNERGLIHSAVVGAEPGSVREEMLIERLGNDGTWKVSQV